MCGVSVSGTPRHRGPGTAPGLSRAGSGEGVGGSGGGVGARESQAEGLHGCKVRSKVQLTIA